MQTELLSILLREGKGREEGKGEERGEMWEERKRERKGERQTPPCLFREAAVKRAGVGRACLLKGPFAPVYRARVLPTMCVGVMHSARSPKGRGQGVPGC